MIQGRIDIYVKKGLKDAFEQLEVISNINHDRNFSETIGKAVKTYISSMQGKKVVADKEKWEILLKDMTKEQLLEVNTQIGELNKMVIDKLCRK